MILFIKIAFFLANLTKQMINFIDETLLHINFDEIFSQLILAELI